MARPDRRARGGAPGPSPRRGGGHPPAALGRPLPRGRPHLRVHALLRRQRRAGARPGRPDRLGRGGDLGVARPGGVPRRPVPARRGRPEPTRWSGPSSCSRRTARWSATRARCPATLRGCAAACRDGRTARSGSPRSRRRSCWPWPPWRPPGPATRRPSGTGSRPRLQPRHGDAGGVARASGEANRQVEVDVATFTQWIDAYAQGEASWRPSTASASATSSGPPSSAGSPPGRSRTPRRPRRRSRSPSTGSRRSRTPTASRPRRGRRRGGQDRRRARRAVRPGGGALRDRARAGGHRRPAAALPVRVAVLALGWAVFLGTVAWIATFPVSL